VQELYKKGDTLAALQRGQLSLRQQVQGLLQSQMGMLQRLQAVETVAAEALGAMDPQGQGVLSGYMNESLVHAGSLSGSVALVSALRGSLEEHAQSLRCSEGSCVDVLSQSHPRRLEYSVLGSRPSDRSSRKRHEKEHEEEKTCLGDGGSTSTGTGTSTSTGNGLASSDCLDR